MGDLDVETESDLKILIAFSEACFIRGVCCESDHIGCPRLLRLRRLMRPFLWPWQVFAIVAILLRLLAVRTCSHWIFCQGVVSLCCANEMHTSQTFVAT
jgi:hypothetical protein